MKKFLPLLILPFIFYACSDKESIFELSPQQSMSITGKGVGQDAAYNPYGKDKSIAVVRNLGSTPFSIRVQSNQQIIEEVAILPKEKKNIALGKGYEMYLDSESEGKGKVTFRPFK